MKDLLDKLSSYNLFNYLLPGILFAFFTEAFTHIKLLQKDLIVGVFLYYFLGLVISRVGSLIIEPVLKKIRFVEFAPYQDYVKASKIDTKIDVLSEANNMYRTFCALFLLIDIVVFYDFLSQKYLVIEVLSPYLCLIFLLILFLVSYRKQTAYIKKRISANQQP
jgi:hypothetical protein